jgi:hypothetical protein
MATILFIHAAISESLILVVGSSAACWPSWAAAQRLNTSSDQFSAQLTGGA